LRGIELGARLRYTGGSSFAAPSSIVRRNSAASPGTSRFVEKCMTDQASTTSTFDTVANIISETCDIPRDNIKPESHAINDLGIDSLDFLDIAFAIDKAFGIKMPLEQWTQEVNDGKATTDQYFQLNNLCTRIDELVAAKSA
jgi:acyl carrier protein